MVFRLASMSGEAKQDVLLDKILVFSGLQPLGNNVQFLTVTSIFQDGLL